MQNTIPNVYYKGSIVTEDDYPELATEFKISYEVVFRCVEQLKLKKEVPINTFTGTTRERVRALASALTTSVTEVKDEAPEPHKEPKEEVIYFLAEDDSQTEPESIEEEESIDPPVVSEEDEIITHAASGLMSAFSDPQGCFIITPEGICTVNPANPPNLERSYEAVAHILKLKELGNVIDDKSSWMLGSSVVALENYHGENNFSVSQVCDETTKAYNTVVTAVGVFKAFPHRYKLSFTHHKEAHYAKIPDDAKKLILSKAESHKLGAKQVRSLCSIAKTMDDDQTIRNIRSKQQAESLIEAYKANKVTYLVFEAGEWFRVKGLAGETPSGAVVINLKSWEASANNGKPIEIPFRAPTQATIK